MNRCIDRWVGRWMNGYKFGYNKSDPNFCGTCSFRQIECNIISSEDLRDISYPIFLSIWAQIFRTEFLPDMQFFQKSKKIEIIGHFGSIWTKFGSIFFLQKSGAINLLDLPVVGYKG